MKTTAKTEKTSLSNLGAQTAFVPVLKMEEVPVLSDVEREELLASLKEAEADYAAGRAESFDAAKFKERFTAICRGEIDPE